MADLLETLLVKLTGDISDLESTFGRAGQLGDGLVGQLSSIGGAVVDAGFKVASAAVDLLTDGLIDSVQGAEEAEKIQAQLAAVLTSTGGAAGMTMDSVNDLATSLSEVTPFEDDAIVAGENMLLTFTNIGKDVFPMAAKSMLDVSQGMGQDMKSSAIQLGKALNDPIAGVSALSRVGVTFSDDQKKVIEQLVKTGDVAGAQKIILAELEKEFGGSAEAAGQTFGGQLTILQNKFGNVEETIGTALLPSLTDLASGFSTWLSDPAIQEGIATVASSLGDLAASAVASIPTMLDWFQQAYDWLSQNQGVIVGILAALGTAVTVFVFGTVLPAILPIIGGILSALGPILLIAGAAYLLYQAWINDFGGIQTFLTGLWTGTLQPIFNQLVAWFQAQLPVAIHSVSS